MKKAFEGFKLSEDDKEKIVDFIKDSIELGYDGFEKLKKEKLIPGWGLKIMKFTSFAKEEYPELYQKFYETLIEPEVLKKVEKDTGTILGKMKNGKKSFIDEHYIDSGDAELVVYKKIRVKIFEHNGKEEKILHIAIPYMQNMNPRPKFGYGILISSVATPQLFADFMADIPQFTGDTDLVSKKYTNAN